MQVRQFTGATIDEVLPKIREELGEDALILQTKRVVRGGIGGFFGREGIEVTAAEGPSHEELATLNAEAAAPVPAAAEEDEPPFARALAARLQAAAEAEAGLPAPAEAGPGTYAPPRGAPAPFAAGGDERTQAIAAAARAAVREAADRAADPLAAARAAVRPAVAGRSAATVPAPGGFAPGLPAGPTPAPAEPAPAPPATPAAARLPAALRGVRAELAAAGIHPRYLDPMLTAVARQALPFAGEGEDPREVVREWLSEHLPVARDARPRGKGHTVVLVGQTGVGKSTTAVKLAARHRDAGQEVALVAAGPGPHDTLRALAARQGIEVVDAPDAAALAAAREALAARDLVVVDTAGRSHLCLEEMEALRDLLGPARAEEVHLVVPVAVPLDDVGDMARRFRMAGVNRVTMTKLDETGHHGNLVNVPMRLGKPLAYLADGAGVPGALVPARARRIAGRLLAG
ncbi:MAG: hypothetical protein MUE51_01310 [Thermoleophilia bacterium]|jgi:flagellar biosynthesis GTPase FlhF|nr:hypothetical protein [Thermoleophilia bacterium]